MLTWVPATSNQLRVQNYTRYLFFIFLWVLLRLSWPIVTGHVGRSSTGGVRMMMMKMMMMSDRNRLL